MIHTNAVLQLRHEHLQRSTKPFRARGCRAIRCDNCLLPAQYCLCSTITPVTTQAQFCLIMYDTEPLKPSNTGRLIADILPNTCAYLWSRTSVSPQLLELLNRQDLQPYIVFPESYASPQREIITNLPDNTLQLTAKTPLFILLDGTWPEACKMFRKSPYLDSFPMWSLNTYTNSDYVLREAPRQQQRCTVEVAIELLDTTGESFVALQLKHHFQRFKQHYLAAKMNRAINTDFL